MITDPSVFKAAKAPPSIKGMPVECTATTPLDIFENTEEESPPLQESPQVITDPSIFTAAKAEPVEYTATTPLDMFKDTEEESPP